MLYIILKPTVGDSHRISSDTILNYFVSDFSAKFGTFLPFIIFKKSQIFKKIYFRNLIRTMNKPKLFKLRSYIKRKIIFE
jgi:hypothetical protein